MNALEISLCVALILMSGIAQVLFILLDRAHKRERELQEALAALTEDTP
jgi:hypothetical protein